MRRLVPFSLALALHACASGTQYSVTASRPVATTQESVAQEAGAQEAAAQEVLLSGDAGPAVNMASTDASVIFASQQVIALGPNQFYLYGGLPLLQTASLNNAVGELQRGSLSGGLVNALIPADRVVVSLGAISVGVQPAGNGNLGGTLTTTTPTLGGAVSGATGTVGSVGTAVSGATGSVGTIGTPVGTTVGTVSGVAGAAGGALNGATSGLAGTISGAGGAVTGTVAQTGSTVGTVLNGASNAITSGNLASGINTIAATGPATRLPLSTP